MKLANTFLGRIVLLVAFLCFAFSGISVLAQDEQIAASSDLAVSLHLPAGYVFSSQQGSDVYSSVLVWAEDATLLERAIQSFYLGGATGPGNFGVVVVVNSGYWSLFSGFPEDALPQVLQIATTNPAAPITVNQQFQYDIGGLYTALVVDATSEAINRRSYLGGFVVDNEMILFSLNTSPLIDFEAEAPLLEAIGDSIRIPAEQGASTSSLPVGTPTLSRPEDLPTRAPSTQGAPTEAVPAAEDVFVVAEGNRLSITLPSNWIVYDLADEENVYAFGEHDGTALSRFGDVRPDLVTGTAGVIVGTGGVVVLYPMSDFGIDPEAVELEPLMTQLLQNLNSRNYEVVEPAAPFGDDGGLIVLLSGTENGFIALVPFGDEIAYITATSVDAFEANRDLLLSIVQSVSVPAAEPPVEAEETQQAGGLGGLGGLQQATPTPAKGGLGGLIGAATGTPEATAVGTPEVTAVTTPEATATGTD